MDGSTPERPDWGRLEGVIGYRFRDRQLLSRAMTHPSYAHENQPEVEGDNQRLEFLGDAVLGLAVARRLYQEFPGLPEGRLSRLKAALVCEEMLATVAAELGLGEYLLLGRGERASGGHEKASILADALEALFAAVYRDGGYEAAEQVVDRIFDGRIDEGSLGDLVIDHKTALQEYVQARGTNRPVYQVVARSGPPHDRTFTVHVSLADRVIGAGTGRSKKDAQKRAAAAALARLKREENQRRRTME